MFLRALSFPLLLLSAFLSASLTARAESPEISFPHSTIDQWQGHPCHQFQIEGKNAWVVVPKKVAEGLPWTWVMEFPTAFVPRTGVPVLLEKFGICHAHLSDFNRFGCDDQLRVMDEFYQLMVKNGFSRKPVLIGLSRGGFMAYRWAVRHPNCVAGIYGDAPVCDLKSWPAGWGKGTGSKNDWEQAKSLYGWKSDDDVRAFRGNPVDDEVLTVLAQHHIPLYHVVGDADDAVPVAENTAIVEQKYRKLGGRITVVHHPAGHHPHGLDDPTPTISFITKLLLTK